MLMRLAVVAVAVALGAGAGSSAGIGSGISTAVVAQVPSTGGSPAGSPAVTTTSHPPVPADPSRYWLIPEPPPSLAAARQTPTAGLALARGVGLIADEDFAGGLALVNSAALGATPLAQYARYYTAVALLGLGRADEAATTLAALDGRVDGYLKEALPLRMAEAALARNVSAVAVGILEKASIDTVIAPEEVLLRLGAAMEAAGEPERALRTYRRVYDEFPMSEQASAAEEAIAALKPPPGIPADRVQDELARAERLFTSRQWTEARAGFAPLLPLVTSDDRELVALRLAESDHYLGRNRAARDALAPLLETAPREAEARYFHLTATRAMDLRVRYVALARGLVADHPDSRWAEETLNNLASHYIIIDNEEEADDVFRELVRRFPRGRFADRAAWKIGWLAYKDDRFAETATTFEAAAVVSPRANYRPSWLYWAARSHDQLGNQDAATVLYRIVAGDYLNSYYGRLASEVLATRGEAAVRPIVVTGPADAAPAALVPTATVIRALASVELYDQALQEVEYAIGAWGDSSALQATVAWLRHHRALQPQAADRFADLRGAITIMRRTYPQFLAAGGEQLPPDVLRIIFPLDYWPLIKKYTDAHRLDPYLVTALISQESTFTADIRSSANAVGLMQLIPGTARRLAARLGIGYSSTILTQPETNIRLGMRYFKDLMDRFGGAHFALAGYNAGERRVAQWIAERPGFEQDEFIDDIPFPETQNYVKRILGTADDYRRLYDDGRLRLTPVVR
jgi:soluble lytic murein transglycosylase